MKTTILVINSRGQKVYKEVEQSKRQTDLFTQTLPGVFFSVSERR